MENEKNEGYAQQLLESLRDQALHGGTTEQIEPSEATGENSGGPYWRKDIWKKYCSKIIGLLVQECGYSQERAEKAVEENSQGVITWE